MKVDLPDGQADSWAWWVSDHAAATQVYRDDTTFARGTADDVRPFLRLAPLILTQDGDHHRALRSLVNREFTKPRVDLFRPSVEALVSRHLDAMLALGEPADLIEHLAWPVSLDAITEIVGAPEEGREQFHVWGDMLLSTGPNRAEENQTAMAEMTGYAARLMTERHNNPTDDILSAAVANAERLEIQPMEAALLVASLVVAGWETTAAAIAATVYALLTIQGDDGNSLYSRICARPDLIPGTVEEMLRLIPNSWFDAGQPRRAVRDTELAGVPIKAGDLLVVAHDHANRDPAVFPDPDRIDPTRRSNPHLAFGTGAHFCLGAHLARLELTVALEELTRRTPALRVVGEVAWNHATPIRRPERLPVAWT
ncbi:cytochrome P450 [Actinomadura violacea]|uniref:Cytochrome P450 n=1 Tax=Actinomadura violacea TaxID=2819934 RepID=A0ABS3S4X1_9ACTN|nr:cytochrome P450 [Actinomadura violacea]MBO2464012.1 cytochrome P450 [Actinomadura violacea]